MIGPSWMMDSSDIRDVRQGMAVDEDGVKDFLDVDAAPTVNVALEAMREQATVADLAMRFKSIAKSGELTVAGDLFSRSFGKLRISPR